MTVAMITDRTTNAQRLRIVRQYARKSIIDSPPSTANWSPVAKSGAEFTAAHYITGFAGPRALASTRSGVRAEGRFRPFERHLLAQGSQIVGEQDPQDRVELHPDRGAEDASHLGAVADDGHGLARPDELVVDADVSLPVETHQPEGPRHQVSDGVALAGADHEVVSRVEVEQRQRQRRVFGGVAPVAHRIQIAKADLLTLSGDDLRHAARDLAEHELRR